MSVQACVHKILAQKRVSPVVPTSFCDWDLEESGTTDALELLKDPGVSLYCFDPMKETAVFVRCPAEEDLTRAPFFFLAQYEHAQMVYTIPVDNLPELVEQLPRVDESKFILLFSIGRCGSTLMSKIFDAVPDVVSIPDPHFVFLNYFGYPKEKICKFLELGTRLQCKQIGPRKGSFYAMKFPAPTTDFISLYAEIFPRSRRLFLYRNAEAFFTSAVVAFGMLSNPMFQNMPPQYSEHSIRIADNYKEKLNTASCVDALALQWQSMLLDVKDGIDKGDETLCYRYEELMADTPAVMKRILDFCGLPALSGEDMAAVLREDSQKGTSISKEAAAANREKNTPTAQHIERYKQVLAMHSIVNCGDYLLPGTLVLPISTL